MLSPTTTAYWLCSLLDSRRTWLRLLPKLVQLRSESNGWAKKIELMILTQTANFVSSFCCATRSEKRYILKRKLHEIKRGWGRGLFLTEENKTVEMMTVNSRVKLIGDECGTEIKCKSKTSIICTPRFLGFFLLSRNRASLSLVVPIFFICMCFI